MSKVSGSTVYNKVDLFVNPTSNVEGTATVSKTATVTGLSAISYFDIRTARLDADDVYYFDNLTLGTTFADVVPVPEPSTALLLGLSGIGLALRRRRNPRAM